MALRRQVDHLRSVVATGFQFDEVQVCKELGRGGMGTVYLAEDRSSIVSSRSKFSTRPKSLKNEATGCFAKRRSSRVLNIRESFRFTTSGRCLTGAFTMR